MQAPLPTALATLSPQSLAEVRFSGRPSNRPSPPAELVRLPVRKIRASAQPLTPAELAFVEAAFRVTGHEPGYYRPAPLRRRLRAALRTIRAASVEEGLAKIAADPSLAPRVMCALLIGYSAPFRDEPVFRKLRDDVLPSLTAGDSGGRRRGIRVWSAACSNGAELYSLALLLAELCVLGECELRGSDSRGAAIAAARDYRLEFWKNVPLGFESARRNVDRGQFMDATLNIDWRVENIFASRERARWDLICCRNLAIYLQPDAAATLWQAVFDALTPGGYLVTGKAERPAPAPRWRRLDRCIYQAVS